MKFITKMISCFYTGQVGFSEFDAKAWESWKLAEQTSFGTQPCSY